jgi:hypothetical protein
MDTGILPPEAILLGREHCNLSPLIFLFIFSGSGAQRGLRPPRSRGILITHNDAPQSVGLLWMSDQLVAKTYTWQHTTHMLPVGFGPTIVADERL